MRRCGSRLHKSFIHSHEDLYETFASFSIELSEPGFAPDGRMDLYDGVLRAIGADGATIFDGVAPADYRDH